MCATVQNKHIVVAVVFLYWPSMKDEEEDGGRVAKTADYRCRCGTK